MRIAIITLGCKINQYDSAVIQSRLEQERHSFVPFDEGADFYIINGCTVTDHADWEARQLVRRAKRLSPGARVLVTGCYAQVSYEEIAQVPGVDFVVGLNRLDDLLRFVDTGKQAEGRVAVGDVRQEKVVHLSGTKIFPGHTRAFLKIQEGCNYSCTFCIIPIARGRSRSVPSENVLNHIRSLAEAGFVEVVLTGIHLGSYGHDLEPKTDLSALIERIAESGLVTRLRLSSLDPREVPERLLSLMAVSEVLCPHLHVCLQAGEDRILKDMRRNYDTAYYRNLLTKAREMVPTASIGSDVIVGFPGETEYDFHRSLEVLDSLPLTYLHVFPYSVRRGTLAASLPGHVAPKVKKDRAKKVRELGARKKKEFYRGFVGRRVQVLVEHAVDQATGAHKGYSRNYLPVLIQAEENQVNREVEVSLEELEGRWLRGTIIAG